MQENKHQSSECWFIAQTSQISWITANGETGLGACVEWPQAIHIWPWASRTLHLVEEAEVCDFGLTKWASWMMNDVGFQSVADPLCCVCTCTSGGLWKSTEANQCWTEQLSLQLHMHKPGRAEWNTGSPRLPAAIYSLSFSGSFDERVYMVWCSKPTSHPSRKAP